jgi:hypothetical protein
MRKQGNDWLFALALTLPMLVFFAGYLFNHSAGLKPTGFYMYDNVAYAAYAREYLDYDGFHLFYSNPLNDSQHYPKIYFQSQNIFVVLLLFAGIPPGFALMILTWVFTFLCFRLIIALYDHLVPQGRRRRLSVLFFCWGGGLLAMGGIPVTLFSPGRTIDFLDHMFILDPGWGWWGLNFGRAMFIGLEAYYHFIFLAIIYFVLKKDWKAALLLQVLLTLSHPFNGIELLCIVGAWIFLEKIILRRNGIPWYFAIGTAVVMAFHVFYYLWYLNQFPDHKSVSDQYALNWRLRFYSMIPAYCIVGALALLAWISSGKEFLREEKNRLFLCWFVVAFLLSNHEIFMKPMQPIHFTRGYIWTGLFLLGLAGLQKLYQWADGRKLARWMLVAFAAFFLSDNFLWVVNYARFKVETPSAFHLSREQQDILSKINEESTIETLVIGKDETLPYLTSVYTKAYTWMAHPFTTPFAQKKAASYQRFLLQNQPDSAWRNRDLIFIFRKADSLENLRSKALGFPNKVLIESENYRVIKGATQ